MINCHFCDLSSPVERTDWQQIHYGVEDVEVTILYACPDHFETLQEGHKRVAAWFKRFGIPKLQPNDENSAARVGQQIQRIAQGIEAPPDDPFRR